MKYKNLKMLKASTNPPGLIKELKRDIRKYWSIYLMVLPLLVYYIIFRYGPMYGAVIAFLEFKPLRGISGSAWVGFKHFLTFFNGFYFTRTLTNTLIISFETLLFGFPAPILLALLFNELNSRVFKKTAQTISYLPHFISTIVLCGIVRKFTASDGVISDILFLFGKPRETLLLNPALFRTIYVISDVWQTVGWGSIIYLSALASVDPQLYEAAKIDGAGRIKQVVHITIPGIAPTIIIMLILRVGRIMDVGYEKIMLLYNEVTYETADVISTYVYRKGILNGEYDYSTAVGLFNSVVNFMLIIGANAFSRRVNETSLW